MTKSQQKISIAPRETIEPRDQEVIIDPLDYFKMDRID